MSEKDLEKVPAPGQEKASQGEPEKETDFEEEWYSDSRREVGEDVKPGMEHYYMLFNNSNEAFAMHQAMDQAGLSSRIAPTPRQLSICCGVTLLIEYEEIPAIKELAREKDLSFLGIQGLDNKFDGHRHKYA